MTVAACLSQKPTILNNVPVELHDVKILLEILEHLGAKIEVN